jgi:tetratricopeptide (TPR) repeat protein
MSMSRSCLTGGALAALLTSLSLAATYQPVPVAPDTPKPPWQRLLQGDDARRAAALQRRVSELKQVDRLPEAIAAARQLLELRQQVQGPDHWEAVEAREQLAALRHLARQPDDVRRDERRVADLLGQVMDDQKAGRLREAAQAFRQIVAITARVYGENHLETARVYSSLAYDFMPNPVEAERYHRKALAVVRKVLGDDHPDTAACYAFLGKNLSTWGRYAEAEACDRRALAIRLRTLGEEHALTIQSCNNLAHALSVQGKVAEAEVAVRKALLLSRKALGESHHGTGLAYNNLAGILEAQGRLAEAENCFRSALAVFRRAVGEEHRYTALGYLNLAAILDAQGRYAAATAYHRQALACLAKLPGDQRLMIGSAYSNMATALAKQGKHAEAEEKLREALALFRQALGEGHPTTANCLTNLAVTWTRLGKHAEAEKACRQALTVLRQALGEHHPITIRCQDTLAGVELLEGHSEAAVELLTRSAESYLRSRAVMAPAGLVSASSTRGHSPLEMLAAVLAGNGQPARAWQRLEQSLGRSTWDEITARQQRSSNEWVELRKLQGNLDKLDRLLQQTAPRQAPTPAQEKQRKDLLARRAMVQAKLVQLYQHMERVSGFKEGLSYPLERVQAALPADTAFLAWVDLAWQRTSADGEHWAVLVRSRGEPVWVRLPGGGPEGKSWTREDAELPDRLLQALAGPGGTAWRELARRLAVQRIDPIRKHLAARDGLPAVRHLIVLPSSLMAGLPVELLVDKVTVSYAPSATVFTYLRDRERPRTQGLLALGDPVFELPGTGMKPAPLPPHGLLVTTVVTGSAAAECGLRANDVLLRYHETALHGQGDLTGAMKQPALPRQVRVDVWRGGRTITREVQPGPLGAVFAEEPARQALARRRRPGHGDTDVPALPGTRVEVEVLQRLFTAGKQPVRLLTDSEASEQRLLELAEAGELGKVRYLHLATHCTLDNRRPLQSAVILARDTLPDAVEQLQAGKPAFDGRLTAEKVVRDWKLDAELVTLSACQTGLGIHEIGEGYVGFAQALLLAGSRSVCLSLWKVDDAATALLMARFHENLLGARKGLVGPLGKAAALAEAQQWLRTLPRSAAVAQAARLTQGVARSKGRPLHPLLPEVPAAEPEAAPYAHPYYWAAFVVIGDPR